MLCPAPEGAKAGVSGRVWSAPAHTGGILPKLPGTEQRRGSFGQAFPESADARRTSGRCGRGRIVAIVREGPEAVWLRVGDVANLFGVSPNTVRRWTDAGRIAAHRSPGGHRRYLADDVLALLPQDEGEGTAQPGDFAQPAPADAGPALHAAGRAGPHVAARRGPARGAGRSRAHPLAASRARRAATSTSPTATSCGWPSPSTAASSTPAAYGAAWTTADWAPADGDPASAPVTCLQATDKGLTRRARLAMQRRGCRSLAWAPLVLRGELVGAIELSDAGDRDFSRHADVLEGLARVCAEAVGDQAHGRRARASRQERARAGRALTGGRADPRLRALRPALRAAAADRHQRRLRRTCGARAAA